ncbi:MAG: hypothetical protein ACOYK4_04565 [Candidatus Planktophila sp.]
MALITVMPNSEINDNSELLGALFALNSRLESAPGDSDCQYTVAELSAWLKDEGYNVGQVAQFFLENPCSAAPWASPELLITTFTMAVKSETEVITFVDQLDQQVPGFSQAAFTVIDSLLGTTQDLMATAGGLSGKTATFLKQHPIATTVMAGGALTGIVLIGKSIKKRLAERAASALEDEAPRLERMVDHAALNVASEEMQNPAVMRQIERAEIDPVREAERSARSFENVEINTDLPYFKQAKIVEEKATSLAQKHLDTYLDTITEEIRQADKVSSTIDDWAKFDQWRWHPIRKKEIFKDFKGNDFLNETEKWQKLMYKGSDEYKPIFENKLESELNYHKMKLANAYKATLRGLDEEAIEAADTAEKRIALAADNSINELEVVVDKDVLKTASSAAIEFENQLAEDIASAAEKADNLIDDTV